MNTVATEPEYPIDYEDRLREYRLRILDGGNSFLVLRYCPFCGGQLPAPLREVWQTRLEVSGFDVDSENIPQHFLDGTWWREEDISYERGDPSPNVDE